MLTILDLIRYISAIAIHAERMWTPYASWCCTLYSAYKYFSRENIKAIYIIFKYPIIKIFNKDKIILPGLKEEL